MTERGLKIPAPAEGRLAPPTQNLLILAREEATALGQNFIGTESILLGLLRLPDDDPAKEILVAFGLNLNMVHWATMLTNGRYDRTPIGKVNLTPRGNKVISMAIEETNRLHETYITPLHILSALVRENEGIAADVLENLGVDMATLRTAISGKRQTTGKDTQTEKGPKKPTLVSVTCKLQAFLHNPNATQEEKDELLREIDSRIPSTQTQP